MSDLEKISTIILNINRNSRTSTSTVTFFFKKKKEVSLTLSPTTIFYNFLQPDFTVFKYSRSKH